MEWEGRQKRYQQGEMGKCLQIKGSMGFKSKAHTNFQQCIVMQVEVESDRRG